MENTTIAAIASGLTTSGIGIIRISGDNALFVADKLMRVSDAKGAGSAESAGNAGSAGNAAKLSERATHTVNYGFVVDGDGQRIDEVLALIMKAPRSYTGEDVVEIQCHGGPYIMKRILDLAIEAGAKLAQPGEFTKRAFLNGRIDLSQAEAVMDLIGSNSEYARKAAFSQLRGSLKEKVSEIRSALLYDCAYLEAALDDPEHISLDGFDARITATVDKAISELDELIKKADEGKIVREGIRTVILGQPNAGKSTLLNLLLGEERAIVTSIPGTTRDTLEESVRLKGISLRLIDTAGLRETSDEVEKIGVDKAVAAAKQADLIIYMIDGSKAPDAADIEKIKAQEGAPVIILINKTDVENTNKCLHNKAFEEAGLGEKTLFFSAKTGEGREELEQLIYELFCSQALADANELIIANSRQKEALAAGRTALMHVKEAVEAGMPEDLYTVDLMDAYTALALITGEAVSDDLANEIFDKFCMGK